MDNNERMEKILALNLLYQMKEESQLQKVQQLSLAGFTNVEIANLLNTTSAVVRQVLYESRKSRGKAQKDNSKVATSKKK